MNVQVFKTTVTQPQHIQTLCYGLDALGHWNFDMDDCDHVLRVETCACDVPRIVTHLAAHGFGCEELPD